MAVQWVTLRQQQDEAGGYVTVGQHWYLTEDKTRVVTEGDPDGRWLWASPGSEVPLRDAIRLGAVKVEVVGEDGPELDPPPVETQSPADEEPAEPKAAKQAPNKARKPGANKAAATGEGE